MRIAILWTELSGYFDACLRALAALPNVKLLVAHRTPSDMAPFDEAGFAWISDRYSYEPSPNASTLLQRLERFDPDVLLVSSWHIPAYRKVLRRFSGRTPRILAMDNQWLGTPKQWLGVLTARWYLHPLYDAAFVPGERQATFAHNLGFQGNQIWRGLYSCDHEAYSALFRQRSETSRPPKAFLFVGRLSSEKGVDTLLQGYRRYRAETSDPWPLIVCGKGPLRASLDGVEGLIPKDFLQTHELAAVVVDAGCLVLPSRFEPWGVVIHEAATAGLAVICSDACGAADHLVQDGYNGYIVAPDDATDLAAALRRYSSLDDAGRLAMSVNSHTLSLRYTPQRWATYFHARAAELLARANKG